MKCPKCKALVPSSASQCSECGYDFPEPSLGPPLSSANLLLLLAALICLIALGWSALSILVALTSSSRSTADWLLGIGEALGRTIVIAALIVVFLRSQK